MKYVFKKIASKPDMARIAPEVGGTGFLDDARAIAAFRVDPGETDPVLVAIAVLQNISTIGAEVHFVATKRNWATKRLLTAFFRYAFEVCRFPILRAPIAEHNVATQIAALKAGFRIDGRIRSGAADGADAILMTMKRDECRWILPQNETEPPSQRMAETKPEGQ